MCVYICMSVPNIHVCTSYLWNSKLKTNTNDFLFLLTLDALTNFVQH